MTKWSFLLFLFIQTNNGNSFQPNSKFGVRKFQDDYLRIVQKCQQQHATHASVAISAAKGFGSFSKSSSGSSTSNKKSKLKKQTQPTTKPKPFVKSDQAELLASLAKTASVTCLGKVVSSAIANGRSVDTFWELIPSLISSRFPQFTDRDLERVAGFLRHTLNPDLPIEKDIVDDPWRPHHELHAYMPGLGSSSPFLDASQVQLCQQLSDNYDVIRREYDALLADMTATKKDRFQSVTTMNYDSGWKALVLFYNGHRIAGFPYHLCPTTTRLLESVPLAGRIAGFNRQQPGTGIPCHSDGNNMWLTCQMGIYVPGANENAIHDDSHHEPNYAYIRVGPERRYWKTGECLLYDTTFEHETRNDHPTQERVVLHVDFFNTLRMTEAEIQVMQYIYNLREQFLKAEGETKVGAHVL